MTRTRVRVTLSVAALSVLALPGTPSTARAQVCGPGSHWVDVCAPGVDVFPSFGTMTVNLFGFGTFTLNTVEVVQVWRGAPTDQYIHPFRGAIGAADGHADVIPTELNLSGTSVQLLFGAPVVLTAGDGIPNGLADNARFSPGAIDEYPPTAPECPPPAPVPLTFQACSFFDVFFQIEHPQFGRLRNLTAAPAVGEEPICSIDVFPYACPSPLGGPPRPLRYRKVGNSFVLVDDAGQPRGELVAFNHIPTPIPEPATVGLLATGLAGAAGVALRRRRHGAA